MPGKAADPEVVERAQELRGEGKSFGDIGKELNIPKSTAHLYARTVEVKGSSAAGERADADLTKPLSGIPPDESVEELVQSYRATHTNRLEEEDRVRTLRAQVEGEELQHRLDKMRSARENETTIAAELASLKPGLSDEDKTEFAATVGALTAQLNELREGRHALELEHARNEARAEIKALTDKIDNVSKESRFGSTESDLWLSLSDKAERVALDAGGFISARFDSLERMIEERGLPAMPGGGPTTLPPLNWDGQSPEDIREVGKTLGLDPALSPAEIQQELERRRQSTLDVARADRRDVRCGSCGTTLHLDLAALDGAKNYECDVCHFILDLTDITKTQRRGAGGYRRN